MSTRLPCHYTRLATRSCRPPSHPISALDANVSTHLLARDAMRDAMFTGKGGVWQRGVELGGEAWGESAADRGRSERWPGGRAARRGVMESGVGERRVMGRVVMERGVMGRMVMGRGVFRKKSRGMRSEVPIAYSPLIRGGVRTAAQARER